MRNFQLPAFSNALMVSAKALTFASSPLLLASTNKIYPASARTDSNLVESAKRLSRAERPYAESIW